MNNEPTKPIPAQELTEKELEGVVGGGAAPSGTQADASQGETNYALSGDAPALGYYKAGTPG